MKTLPPQHLRYGDYERLLARIDEVLWELVYAPIVDVVRPALPKELRAEISPRALQEATAHELRNAGEAALRKALKDGVAQMTEDRKAKRTLFTVAKPDRRISDGLRSFGATIDRRSGVWSCSPDQVPSWVRLEAESYGIKARELHDSVRRILDDIEGRVERAIQEMSFAKSADHAITEVAKGWKESAKDIQASWNLGESGKKALAADFEETAKIPIKGWAKEAIGRLRTEVSANAASGYRAAGLAEKIRNEYGMSKNRADLIARQETNNFMANFRKARALDAGLKKYLWTIVGDSRTRPDHKKLNGTVQYYNRPPIVNQQTGKRGNPGQDFRCRCVDRPVIE